MANLDTSGEKNKTFSRKKLDRSEGLAKTTKKEEVNANPPYEKTRFIPEFQREEIETETQENTIDEVCKKTAVIAELCREPILEETPIGEKNSLGTTIPFCPSKRDIARMWIRRHWIYIVIVAIVLVTLSLLWLFV